MRIRLVILVLSSVLFNWCLACLPRSSKTTNKPSSSTLADVTQIKSQLLNQSKWWFGDRYRNELCPKAPTGTRDPSCANSNPKLKTLGSRLFDDLEFGNKMDEYLKNLVGMLPVTYRALPGTAFACNSSFTESEAKELKITPASGPIPAFYVRNEPEIDAPQCTDASLCAVVFYDAGNMYLHNVWVNYPNNSEMSDYNPPGPTNPSESNPYVWLVFGQKDGGRIENPNTTEFKLTKFMKSHGLTGPILMNIVQVRADLYAYSNAEKYNWYQNCPALLEIKLEEQNGVISRHLGQPINAVHLDTWIPAQFEVKKFDDDQEADAASKTFREWHLWLDPIENPCLDVDTVKNEPSVTIEPRMVSYSKDDLKGTTFTLIMVQILPEEYGNLSNTSRIKWLKKNFDGFNDGGGITVVPFQALENERSNLVNFYLIAFRQPEPDLVTLDNWLDGHCNSLPAGGNCTVDLADFATAQNLQISGMNRFRFCSEE